MAEILATSSALIAAIFLLRKLTVGKIGMRVRYALWLLAALRLLVPVCVGASPFSVLNLVPETFLESGESAEKSAGGFRVFSKEKEEAVTPQKEEGEGQAGPARETDGRPGKARTVTTTAHSLRGGDTVLPEREESGRIPGSGKALGLLWLMGFLTVGGRMLFMRIRFVRWLYGHREILSRERIQGELAGWLSRRGMQVYRVRNLPSPCLVGRCIYVGEREAEDERILSHVLAHEYCHAVHGDGFWAFLRCALAAVYWFDPFVWAAAFAARQDSELACDEAAVRLLGEEQRFAYGRTLLFLLNRDGVERERCPGMSFMTEGSRRSVKERISLLAKGGRTRRTTLFVVLAAAVLVCGCAFTGADRKEGEAQADGPEHVSGSPQQKTSEQEAEEAGRILDNDERDMGIVGETKEAAERILAAEGLTAGSLDEERWQAFEETLHSYDDSELLQKREFDVQSYYDWKEGKGGEKPEDGWYLLCRESGGLVSLYGLYTQEFGFRGLKTRIGEDVNTLDLSWCASYLNGNSENIRILELAQDGRPRRFAWKLLVEESEETEKWRLYEGYRYDTGTISLRTLTEEECVEWGEKYLAFDVDQEEAVVHVTCDGDMYLGAIDISAYKEWETEDVRIVPDTVGVSLEDTAGEDAAVSGEEGLAVHLAAGLKLKGVEGLWFDGLPLLTIRVAEDEDSDSGFLLQTPRIDERHVARALWQERELARLRDGIGSETGREEPNE